ncbi:MAG: radical SAM protein [Prevotellaceae bacterium]|jgi:uncharacterized protein|nr:radical SAM protein [Prevotellaceae bacterium]
MEINQIVIKVTSKCNLNCKYCFVYNQGNENYKFEPNFISEKIITQIFQKIENYCVKNPKIQYFYIVFHGGEPLLTGKNFYINAVKLANEIVKSVELKLIVQTNGTLLDNSWAELFKKLNITCGISLDGTEHANRFRIFKHNNKPAYQDIIKGIKTLNDIVGYCGVLSVINPLEPPKLVYENLKNLNINFVDFLIPDVNYETFEETNSLVGNWLKEMFDIWYKDKSQNRIEVRFFDTVIKLFLGDAIVGDETVGRNTNSVITIKTNGNMESVDSLNICNLPKNTTSYNIIDNQIPDIFNDINYMQYYNAHQNAILCKKCNECILKDVCGGGQLCHRYSIENGFNNPSVYCYQMFDFFAHVQNRLIDDLPSEILNNAKIEKISISDYK